MSYIFSAEAKKNLAISCACFGAAAVAGVGLIVSNLNKTPEQVGKSDDHPVEVPYTSSVEWEDLDVSKELIVADEGEVSVGQITDQFEAFAAEQTSNGSKGSIAPKPTQPDTPTKPTEPEKPEEPDYLLEQDLHEDGVVYMQDVTQDMIDEMTEETMTVVDRRTGYSYEVYRGYPGSRWGGQTLYMSTDLKLGSVEKPMLLTPKNTNIYSNYVLPASTDVKEYSSNNPIEESINIDGDLYLYSPAAALAGSQLEDFGNDIVIYNSSESICPAGWRLPMDSEDYNSSDGMTETDFNSEVGNMVYHIANETNNWNLPDTPYASSTLRMEYDYNEETGASIPLGITMKSNSLSGGFGILLKESSIVHVRCMFGSSFVRRSQLTLDYNGGKEKYYDDWVGEEKYLEKEEHVRVHGGDDDIFYPSGNPERDGYKFLGWSKNKNATTPEYYDNGAWENEPNHYPVIKDVLAAPITFYAVWEKARLFTFHCNGGESSYGDVFYQTLEVDDNTWISGDYTDPHRRGYTFMGWATTPDATEVEYVSYDGAHTPYSEYPGDLELYAVWGQE